MNFKDNKRFLVVTGILVVVLLFFFIRLSLNHSTIQQQTNLSHSQQAHETNSTSAEAIHLVQSGNSNKYEGAYYSAIIPSNWTASRTVAASCGGEMDLEDLQLTIPTTISDTTNTISVCSEKYGADLNSYVSEKKSLQTSLAQGVIDNLTESTVNGQKALLYDFTRKDFPGNYEKTVIVPQSLILYRITWAIHAKDAEALKLIKTATEPQYNEFISSFAFTQ
jgi:hypothetical protein